MGFFSSIGKALGGIGKIAGIAAAPFTGGTSLMATLGSTALDFASSAFKNKLSAGAAEDAFNRSLRASNTSYQRAVADMRAAGLNPILAYSQGGAAAPASGVASVDVPDIGSRALQASTALAGLRNTASNTELNESNAQLAREQVERQRLENEGLKVLPPELRAAAQMGSGTAAAANVAGRGLASAWNSALGQKIRGRTSSAFSSVWKSIKRGIGK